MQYIPGSFPANDTYDQPHRPSSRLPIGTWNLMCNGRVFKIDINKAPSGGIAIDWPGTPVVDPQWEATTQRLTFTRVLPDRARQLFTGYLLHRSEQDPLWRLAGTLEQANIDAESGWYGTQLAD